MPGWIPIVVVLGAIVIFVGIRLFGGKRKRDLVAEAKVKTDNIKAAADAQLAAELQDVDADRTELDQIRDIDDDEARLEALAKYANRRRP